ncbi:uncharacterized protein [Spinacia oleracea]|uniref:Retrotransposon gag domain-containing protein n=1 Tax=Spinacia oleracea TaxID=3562 RepID=A0A9R0J0T2_SPIOL|nr:uncharacterized protein LOC110797652 [Spinacia oleracea]
MIQGGALTSRSFEERSATRNQSRRSSPHNERGRSPTRSLIGRSPPRREISRHDAGRHAIQQRPSKIMIPKDLPFTPGILEEPLPMMKLPSHIKYDGSTDPDNHIAAYKGHMYLYTASLAVWCKCFLATLRDLAQTWFKNLKVGPIRNFRHLSKQLCEHFVSNKRREKTSAELWSVKQRGDESLRDYLGRFNREVELIPNMKPDVAILALTHGLHKSRYRDYLAKKNVPNLGAALEKADEYIRIEEFNKTLVVSGHDDDVQPQRTDFRKGDKREKGSQRKKDNTDKYENDEYESYAPLLVPRSQIFFMNRTDDKWQRPRKMHFKNRDQSKWCDFHDDYGHTTDECRDLKNNVEDLIRRGYFKQYRAHSRNRGDNQEDRKEEDDTTF